MVHVDLFDVMFHPDGFDWKLGIGEHFIFYTIHQMLLFNQKESLTHSAKRIPLSNVMTKVCELALNCMCSTRLKLSGVSKESAILRAI